MKKIRDSITRSLVWMMLKATTMYATMKHKTVATHAENNGTE